MWKFVISINFKLSYLSKHIIEIYSLSNGKRQETSVNSWLNRPPSKPDELPQMPPEEPPPVEPPVSPPVTSVTPSVTPEPSVKPPVTSVKLPVTSVRPPVAPVAPVTLSPGNIPPEVISPGAPNTKRMLQETTVATAMKREYIYY